VFGLLFGSFANVVIWRFPRGESLSHPGSHCPVCDAPIAPYDNIPVVSWLLLRARCRKCGASISVRYPAVELLSGLLWLTAGLRFGLTMQTAAAVALFYLLMILSFIDIDTMRLPNPIVALLGIVGVAGVALSSFGVACVPLTPLGPGVLATPVGSAGVGALVCAGVPLVIASAYALLRGREGFGMGDVKMLGVLGVFLGLYGLLAYFIGALFAAAFGIVAGGRDGGFKFPFGPFLASGAVVVALVGPQMWDWYRALIG
jgi:leader peptidase (prepilin peptidase)/N-methyltransferase